MQHKCNSPALKNLPVILKACLYVCTSAYTERCFKELGGQLLITCLGLKYTTASQISPEVVALIKCSITPKKSPSPKIAGFTSRSSSQIASASGMLPTGQKESSEHKVMMSVEIVFESPSCLWPNPGLLGLCSCKPMIGHPHFRQVSSSLLVKH